ncbi:MAG: hypothetical protein ACTHLO_02695 [Pseudolabrys sp.]
MKRRLIRYKVKPEAVARNRALIETVFRDLRAKTPDGVRYLVLAMSDGSFAHVVETDGDTSPLPQLDAHKAFQSGIKERCLEEPVSAEATIVGDYRMIER